MGIKWCQYYATPMYDDTPAKLELLESKIQAYFDNCPDKKLIKVGDEMEEISAYTICGLSLALGFSSRQSLNEYANKKSICGDMVRRAKHHIEKNYELKLDGANSYGVIFALKNMHWKDSQSIEHTGDNVNPLSIVVQDSKKPQQNKEVSSDGNNTITI